MADNVEGTAGHLGRRRAERDRLMEGVGVVGGASARVVAPPGRGVGAECGGDPPVFGREPFELGDLG